MPRLTSYVLAAGVFAFTLGLWLRDTTDPSVPQMPRMECPSLLDLGIVENHQIATGRIIVWNRGGSELILSDVVTSCSCAGLERQDAGIYSRFQSLRISPGQSHELFVRQAMNTPVQDRDVSSVSFATNDPDRPRHTLRIHAQQVVGGFVLSPTVAAFGLVPLGRPREMLIDVLDHSARQRVPIRVDVTGPTISAKVITSIPIPEKQGPRANVVARIAITTTSAAIGDIQERARIRFDPELHLDPIEFFVTACVRGPVSANPKTIVLLLRSDSGSIYAAKVILRSESGVPFTISSFDGPMGWTCRHDGGTAKVSHVVLIERQTATVPIHAPAKSVVKFLCRIDGRDCRVDVELILSSSEGSP